MADKAAQLGKFYLGEAQLGSMGEALLDITGTTGIPSASAFGAYGVVYENLIDGRDVAGIVSALAFGSGGKVAGPLTGTTGIPSALAFGDGGSAWIFELLLNGAGCGIASALAFGTGGAIAGPITGSAGIASAEAFGSGGSCSGPIVGVTGIASAEAFGSGGAITGPITGSAGIPSGLTFGTPGYVAILVGDKGIPSPTVFGTGGTLSWSITGLSHQGIKTGEAFGTTGIVLQLSPVNSVFSVFIGGTQRNQYVRESSLSVERQINFASSAGFEIVDEAGSYFPGVGEEVLVYFYDGDGSGEWERIFAGSVNNVTAGKLVDSVGAPEVVQQVECVDYGQALARRVVTKKFPQVTYGTLTKILEALSVSYFEPEGIKYVSQGDPGITIADLEFSCVPLSEVIAKLGELTGWDSQIDFGKNFWMYDRPNLVVTAPWNIAEDSQESYSTPLVTKHRGLYRNRQCIKANLTRTTSIITFSYTNPTNGWNVDGDYLFYDGTFLEDARYEGQIQKILSVKVDDVDVPWYVPDDEDAPTDWDYAICWGSEFGYKLDMIWNLLGKPGGHPGAGAVLSVTFEVLNEMPRPICVDNTSEIAARKAIEGGTGIYTAVEEVQDVSDRAVLVEYANSLLDRFSEIGVEVNITTHKFGLEPGMQINVDLPSLGVTNQDYLIESMTLTEQAKTKLLFNVTISNSIQQRDALAAFQRLIRRIRKSASTSVRTVQFDLAVTMQGITNPGLAVGANVTNEVLIRTPITLKEIAVSFKTPPAGQSIKLDIKADSVSILGEGYIEYTTSGGIVTYTVFANAPLTLIKGQKLSIDVIQVGTTQPGKDGTVTVTGWA